jgi:hypothetical protein
MKAITLTQPWATLVALGVKRLETRSWKTAHRGPLAIHAAAGFPKECQVLCYQETFAEALLLAGIKDTGQLPLGAVLAVVNLQGCYQMGTFEAPDAATLFKWAKVPMHPEFAFGDYSEGRWAWLLEDLTRLPEPVPVKGALSLWEWNP